MHSQFLYIGSNVIDAQEYLVQHINRALQLYLCLHDSALLSGCQILNQLKLEMALRIFLG